MINTKWHYPVLDQGEADHFNDPLQEHFEGNHEYYIARETIQNALDARDESDKSKPVVVNFEVCRIDTSELPGVDELRNTINQCLAYNESNTKAVKFFRNATELLEKPTVTLLKIGDYRTSGLRGGDSKDEGGQWYRLVKAVGANEMAGDGGGSFGIGKGAPFAASKLRYVLYSTNTGDGVAFQGKAKMTCHVKDGIEYRGTGFWGLNGYQAIRNLESVPEYFKRLQKGTDIYVAGYGYKGDDWKARLIAAVLENFWAAIHFEDLEVNFIDQNSKVTINSYNLSSHIETYKAEKTKDTPWYYYKAVTEPTEVFRADLTRLGKVILYVKKEEDFPRTIKMMRLLKMVVREKGSHHVLPEGYAGVLMLDQSNTAGNKTLRLLEPPKHDEWDVNRGADQGINGRAVIKELDEWVRDCLRSLNQSSAFELDEIPGMNSLLPQADYVRDDLTSYTGDGETNGPEDESANETTVLDREQLEKKHSRKPISLLPSDTGNGKSRVPTSSGKNKGGSGAGSGDDIGASQRMDTSNLTVRAFPVGNPTSGTYSIIFYSPEDKYGAIRIIGAGDDADYPLDVVVAMTDDGTALEVNKSWVTNVNVRAGRPLHLTIGLKARRLFAYSIGVESYVG